MKRKTTDGSFEPMPELIHMAKAMSSLKAKGIIRTKNLVGDLGEHYCQELFGIKLCEIVTKGFDGYDINGKKVEIKTRREPTKSAKVIFRGFEFDYCLFVELNDTYLPITITKIECDEIFKNVDNKGDRLSVSKLKNKTRNSIVYP
jgi:hypothetical protein